jgi:hypothetical protein
MTGRARYDDWAIEVEVMPATDGGWGQIGITVIGDEGRLERKIATAAQVFDTPESAIEDGKEWPCSGSSCTAEE